MNSVQTKRNDKTGKVFELISQDVRMCLICEQLFTRRAASEHTRVYCMPALSSKLRVRDEIRLASANC